MSALVASVAAYTVLLTLLIACGEHLSKPAALSTALTAHRVVPAPSAVAALVIATEGLLGAAGVVALLRDDDGRLLGVVLAASSALLVGYAAYGQYVRSTGRAVPCGCSRAEVPMTGWVVARASALAGLALVGSLLSDAVVPVGRGGTSLTIVLLAAAAFTALLAHLPAAMHDPTPDQPPVRVTQGGVPG
ncbi:methylamine utilization protein MauE [Micromonospora globispora]|uniref:MauE/DoxX family redox-associated membrane protein n=1 Tax=Micromonospora globispora TaxID=1450148 RepID=UPI000D6F54BF|nr:MauE/DoxX family redox-associated membrane protein [Micromonospora globispora]PWU60510.1 methylamine utilization protein MauE [Micromonospora globispora]